jgi:hypothetical protein
VRFTSHRTQATQEIRSFGVLVAIQDVQLPAQLRSEHLAYRRFTASRFSYEQNWFLVPVLVYFSRENSHHHQFEL